MRIEVIEGGIGPGRDLVVREARLNPTAVANSVPQKAVRVVEIGDGYAVLGLGIEPMLTLDPTEGQHFCAVLTVVGGKQSDLVPMVPVKLVLGEVGRIGLAKLREMFAKALNPEKTS